LEASTISFINIGCKISAIAAFKIMHKKDIFIFSKNESFD